MFLAVDGGQSQIRAASSLSSEVITVPGLSRLEAGPIATLVSRTREATRPFLSADAPVERLVLGLSTLPASDPERQELLGALADALPTAAEIWLAGDAATGHAGALPDRHGVSLTVGTGVACIGVDARSGRHAKVNGDGFLLGDAGGAFWIGRHGLAAVIRSSDGRGEPTALTEAAVRRFGHHDDLAAYLHSCDRAVNGIAQFAADVQACADAGDPAAASIIDRAADELLLTIRAAGRVIDGDRIPVAMNGRAVTDGSPLERALVQKIAQEGTIDLRPPSGTPLDGALRLAVDGDVHPYRDLITLWRRSS